MMSNEREKGFFSGGMRWQQICRDIERDEKPLILELDALAKVFKYYEEVGWEVWSAIMIDSSKTPFPSELRG